MTTDPETRTAVTDATGTVLISGIEPGFYSVAAVHDLAGTAAQAIDLDDSDLATLSLRLNGTLPPQGVGGDSAGGSGGKGGGGAAGGRGGSAASGRGGGEESGAGGELGSSGSESGGSDGGEGSNPSDTIDVATQVETMLVDPVRPYLYALDRVNNSFLFVNLETRELEKTIFVGSSPVDLDIDDEGNEIFVANFGSTEIAVVDLETQEVGRTVFVDITLGTWEGNPYRLAYVAGGALAFTSEDQWCDIKLVSAETGVNITTSGSLYQPDLAANADGTRLFVAESGSTGSAVHRFDVTETSLTEADASATDSGFGSRLVVLSGDGEYVFFAGKKMLASNLQSVLGEYSEVIYASNADGSIVIGNTNVFDGTTFTVRAPLPVSTTVMALSPDDGTVYLYDVNTSQILIHELDP